MSQKRWQVADEQGEGVEVRTYTAAATRFYQSTAWRKCRKSYIASVFGLCEKCGKPGTILHHKQPIDDTNLDDQDITLNHDNLLYLCVECHNMIHGGNDVVRDELKFVDGQLVEI